MLFSSPAGNEMFQFPAFASIKDDWNLSSRVAPFGNPRVKGYLHLVVVYRGLSRPSSPPRAQASTARPYLFTFVSVVLFISTFAGVSLRQRLCVYLLHFYFVDQMIH